MTAITPDLIAVKALDGYKLDLVFTGGGEVKFENAASTNWVYNSETKANDFVLVFTNSADASYTLPGLTKARLLVVGGGGGGGGW